LGDVANPDPCFCRIFAELARFVTELGKLRPTRTVAGRYRKKGSGAIGFSFLKRQIRERKGTGLQIVTSQKRYELA
jgi:hypothetical protein